MANLKGGNYQKQIKDAFHRLEAFGIGRVGKNDNLTHSHKLAEKRLMFLKDISNYFISQSLNAKLNTLMTKDNLDKFFNQRLEALAPISKINYLRSFSSMLNGMTEQNIYIPLHYEDKDFFDDRVKAIKDQAETIIENRYIDNVENVISNLYEDRAISGLIAQCQYELSIRQAEAFELVSNPLKYIENGYIENLVGKGNHIYEPKEISFELEQHITKVANQIHAQQPTSSMKDCQNLAINLLIERLLVLQKEYTPQSQRSMVINLFSYLPELKDFRYEMIAEARKKNSLFSKIKSFFKK